MPFVLASTCREITQIRCCEIADYASYDGAEVFAWSDSMAGIVARLHLTGSAHLGCTPVIWSNYDTVSKTVPCMTYPGMFPSMPPVAPV